MKKNTLFIKRCNRLMNPKGPICTTAKMKKNIVILKIIQMKNLLDFFHTIKMN